MLFGANLVDDQLMLQSFRLWSPSILCEKWIIKCLLAASDCLLGSSSIIEENTLPVLRKLRNVNVNVYIRL